MNKMSLWGRSGLYTFIYLHTYLAAMPLSLEAAWMRRFNYSRMTARWAGHDAVNGRCYFSYWKIHRIPTRRNINGWTSLTPKKLEKLKMWTFVTPMDTWYRFDTYPFKTPGKKSLEHQKKRGWVFIPTYPPRGDWLWYQRKHSGVIE